MSEILDVYLDMWRYWKDFEGYSDVREYWVPQIINLMIMIILYVLTYLSPWFLLIFFIYSIVIFIPMFSLMVRRFHDTNRSGWYWLWGFIPIIGELMVLIALLDSRH